MTYSLQFPPNLCIPNSLHFSLLQTLVLNRFSKSPEICTPPNIISSSRFEVNHILDSKFIHSTTWLEEVVGTKEWRPCSWLWTKWDIPILHKGHIRHGAKMGILWHTFPITLPRHYRWVHYIAMATGAPMMTLTYLNHTRASWPLPKYQYLFLHTVCSYLL